MLVVPLLDGELVSTRDTTFGFLEKIGKERQFLAIICD
jgi:hypothetical protein